jgi:hypothetical protein
MNDKQKRKKIREYFLKIGCGWQVLMVVTGIFAFLYGMNNYDAQILAVFGIGLGLIGGVASVFVLIRKTSQPNDRQMDQWFEEDLKEISKHALKKLDLSPELLAGKEPLKINGPILWSTDGVSDGDLLWKKGRDDFVRFSVYKIVMIYTAEHLLAAYSCDFNMLKNVMLNEDTYEFHYRDIVSVTTHETSTSYVLPNGEKLIVVQEFKVSVPGESINVIIDSKKLFAITKGNVYRKDEVERTVQRLRNLLRDKKQSASQPIVASPSPYAAPSSAMPSVSQVHDQSFQVSPPPESISLALNEKQGSPPQSMDRYCSNCGREIKPDDRFCPNCGKQLKF